MYLLYLDHVLFPVAPEKIVTETATKNKTVSLIDGSEVVLRGGTGLKKFSFELLLPMTKYPFAIYDGEFKDASYYVSKLEEIGKSNKAFWFDVYRSSPGGEKTFATNVLVAAERITIEENAENGQDMKAGIVLREYRQMTSSLVPQGNSYGAKEREDLYEAPYTYTVKSGDTLWMIAKKYLGSGEKYTELARINSIKSPYTIGVGQVIRLRE